MLNQQIKRALISVSDKTNLIQFATSLHNLGIEILSTGGTYAFLIQNNIPALEVARVTEFPEILDGRVKTLHPKIYGAILAKRDDTLHMQQLQEHTITPIDLICVNLYPFAATVNKLDATFDEAIENIDIGGPAMIRAGAKNHQYVVVVTDVDDYVRVIDEIISSSNQVSMITRQDLAQKAFAHTAYYDSLISTYLARGTKQRFIKELTLPVKLVQKLRYGENSHQEAAFYQDSGIIEGLLASFTQLQGKDLSYNNLADADTAWETVRQFKETACVIVKHANPCGVALGDSGLSSYRRALSADPISRFGGVIAFNCIIDDKVIVEILQQFVEVLIAPEYTSNALKLLEQKPNIRVIQIKLTNNQNQLECKRIGGGLLVQTPEVKELNIESLKVVTKLSPSIEQMKDLCFAWQVVRMVKSNAIVLVKDGQTIGIGAGQMSRIDSARIALNKAREFGFDVEGAVCASDAFFPFSDNVELLAQAKIAAIIQPGGSIKDTEIFAAADRSNIAMALTEYRTFRH